MDLKKWEQLLKMTDVEWGQYAFCREPLRNKLTFEQKIEYIRKAIESGIEQAKYLQDTYGEMDIPGYIQKLSLQVTKENAQGMDDYLVFARYNYPRDITLFTMNIDAVNAMLTQENYWEQVENVKVENMLLAHEMYHFLEETRENVYSKTKKIVLWSIGPFKYRSGLVALSEIAAMSFAKELLNINYNPYVFDALMLYPHDSERAERLVEEILRFRMEQEEMNE
jgi:hypothetical protein